LPIANYNAFPAGTSEDLAVTPQELQRRFKTYALRCIRLASAFPRGPAGETIGRQLVKAATSAAANYRAACIARSRPDFANKMAIVEEETDESVFWTDLAVDADLARRHLVNALIREGQELLAIAVSSRKTARGNLRRKQDA
jgi:four helix bundle protein